MPVQEDALYKNAEAILTASLAQHKVGMHGAADDAVKQMLQTSDVSISGAPRSISFSERVRDGVNGDNRENLAICVESKLDLRAANDGDVRRAVTDTVKNLMSGDNFKLPDGTALADAYNWDGKQQDKLPVKFDVNNSVRHGQHKSEVHLFLDLPPGVTHWGVVDAIAGEKPLQLKPVGEMAARVTEGRAEATNAAPALTPVVGEQTAKLAEGRAAAANDTQTQQVG